MRGESLSDVPRGVLLTDNVAPRSATAEELLKEYKACESPDYITYVRRISLHEDLAARLIALPGIERRRTGFLILCVVVVTLLSCVLGRSIVLRVGHSLYNHPLKTYSKHWQCCHAITLTGKESSTVTTGGRRHRLYRCKMQSAENEVRYAVVACRGGVDLRSLRPPELLANVRTCVNVV